MSVPFWKDWLNFLYNSQSKTISYVFKLKRRNLKTLGLKSIQYIRAPSNPEYNQNLLSFPNV